MALCSSYRYLHTTCTRVSVDCASLHATVPPLPAAGGRICERSNYAAAGRLPQCASTIMPSSRASSAPGVYWRRVVAVAPKWRDIYRYSI